MAACGGLSPFLSLLHAISAALAEAEVENMKFLCQEQVPKRRREAVRTALELFTLLMEQQLLGERNLLLLRDLLRRIRRADLLDMVQRFEEEAALGDLGDQPDEPERRLLRVATAVIRDQVGAEWKKLMRELGMSEVKLDRIKAAHPFDLNEQLTQGLREWQEGKGRDARVADLIKALRGCHLNLVADLVEEAISKVDAGTE